MFCSLRHLSGRGAGQRLYRGLTGSVDAAEVSKFAAQAAKWWDPDGYAAPLHRMNPLRVAYIRSAIEKHVIGIRAENEDQKGKRMLPLDGVRIVDVGCGGGLVTEPLARLGGSVLGIDMAKEAVEVAREHAKKDARLNEMGNLTYGKSSVEDLVAEGKLYDAVLALEIIEHVADPKAFLVNCSKLVDKDGVLVLSTLNRTVASYLLGVVAAERILRWLPEGTHDWNRFPRPEELAAAFDSDTPLTVSDTVGVQYNPFTRAFKLSNNISVNYIQTAVHKPVVAASGKKAQL